ncbi:MAG: hypoxanthine phosphoribosyltransferase [Pseudomonadota bacterium]
MPELIPVLDSEDIHRMTATMAERLSLDYQGKDVVMVGVLKGAFLFLADLVRLMSIPVKIDFVRASSYGSGTETTGCVQLEKNRVIDVAGKDVLIVEDIVDTGLTLHCMVSHFQSLGAASVKVCTLLDKQERRRVPIEADYVCHAVDDEFLVGYGLDFDESYRELPGIYHLKF